MYSIVMMMALSNGAAAPAADVGYAPVVRTGSHVTLQANKKCGCDCSCGCKGCKKCDCGCKGCKKCHCNCGCYAYACGCGGCACHGAVAVHHAMADAAPVYVAEAASNKATIVVNMPAGAKLLFDDQPTASTASTRTFSTPELEPDKDYFYTLKGEMTTDGQTVTSIKRVKVRANEETRVSLEFPTATVTQR